MYLRRFALIASAFLFIGCGSSSNSDDADGGATQDDADVSECSDNTTCDDGLFCNGVETCDAAGSCVAGTAPVLDDGISCTDDSCDEENDVVVHATNDGTCDDGLFCNGAETCDATAGCAAGTPPVVDDGIDCTMDFCDEEADGIRNAVNDAACDDGLFCNGIERCDPSSDCFSGPSPVLDDGVSCTADTCDETNDVVVNVPIDADCDDGLFCTGVETCDVLLDCVAGVGPADDGFFCTDDVCDEDNDVVVGSTPNNANCDDGEQCTTDVCDPVDVNALADGCVLTAVPNGTSNNCNEANGGVGCNNAVCETCVCALDSFCCDSSWDGICADVAADDCPAECAEVATCDDGDNCGGDTCVDGLCATVCVDDADECTADVCAIGVDTCGQPLTDATLTTCCAANAGATGCDDATCETDVCALNPDCCDVEWDAACALSALDLCGVCFQETATCAAGAGLCNRGSCEVP